MPTQIKKFKSIKNHTILIIVAIIMTIPFIWMILSSFKSIIEVESLKLFPSKWLFSNYLDVFKQIPFAKYYFNSFFIAAWVTFLQCVTCSMAAYAFARLKWKGRDHIFKLYLATMMIPGVVTMIPNYILMVNFQFVDTYQGLIIPAAFSAFGTFLLRQFMLSISPSLEEAAKIDGASHWQIFWNVVIPLTAPAIATLAILTFLGTYGAFMWPLVMITTEGLRTLPIGMMYFDTMYKQQTNLIMAASAMSIIPLIIIFIFGQKHIVKGIMLGGVKG